MSSFHTTAPIQSKRLINDLKEAGIDPEMFARFLSTSLKHNTYIAHPSTQEAFEYGLCAIQAERVILLIAS